MRSNFASITTKHLESVNLFATVEEEIKNLHVSLPAETTVNVVEEALNTKRFETILVERPVTLSYFDIQKLAYKQKAAGNTQIHVNYQSRLHPEVQQLRQKIAQATSSGATINSISINTVQSKQSETISNPQLFALDTQDIDLLLFLTNQDVRSIQAFADKSGSELSSAKFTLLSGNLISGTPFTLQVVNQNQAESVTRVEVSLSTGDVINITVKNTQNATEGNGATLQEASKVVRVYTTAFASLKSGEVVTLKHVEKGVVPVRTVGTAGFLDVGLFVPTSPNKSLAVTGLYSGKQDKLKEIFDKVAATGEPLEYIPDYENLFVESSADAGSKPVFYVPSLPGKRKNQEMLDALKAGFVVLAEKPAFANADLAKDFLKSLNDDLKSRLFFGWHYQHHNVFDRLWKDVSKETFGKIKHVRTYFSVPMVLKNNRIFEPSQGGAGLDIYCYNLHCVLRLLGFNDTFEVTQSNIKSAQDLDPTNKDLSIVDYVLDTKLKFGNGATADLYATFDSTKIIHSEVEIDFEDGTKIFAKEFVHFQFMTATPFSPIVIQRPGSPRWEDYILEEDTKHPEYFNSTYDQQVEFMRRQATGEDHYDFKNDFRGLGIEANIKVHEIIDAVFAKGGFAKKTGV